MQEERRWVVPAGLAVVGLVVLANAAGKVGLGTSGNALVITISVAVYTVAAVVFVLWFTAPEPATVARCSSWRSPQRRRTTGTQPAPAGSACTSAWRSLALAPQLRTPR